MSIQSLMSMQSLSLILLLMGIGLAFSQIRLSGWILGWILLSGALLLQGFRSLLSYLSEHGGVDAATYSIANGWMGLGFSLLIVAAMPMMRDVFASHRRAAESLRIISATANDAIIVLDRLGKITVWNQAAQTIFGYSEQEAQGKKLSELIVPERLRPDFENMFSQFSADGQRSVRSSPADLAGLRKDGKEIVTEYSISNANVEGEWHAIYIVRDLTARRRAEEALRRVEARQGKMFANIGDVIVIIDREGIIKYQSPNIEKWFGWKPDEVVGVSTWDNLYPDDLDATQNFFRALLKGPDATGTTECRYRCKDLSYRWIAITVVNLLHDPDIQGFLGNYHDITERKRAETIHASLEAQLRESQKMEAIGTLAGGIAHDFNNALATILGNTELARQDVSANPLALESLEEIRKAGSRARGLVQQILSFSRRQPTERKRLTLASVVEECARLLRATLPSRLSLEVNCDADVPPVLADATQIQQVVINLATNAMQAMPSGHGRIAIQLDTVELDAAWVERHPVSRALYEKRPGRTARLMVSDNGPGMDAATLSRIFEPFFTTKAVDEGTGLGLSVVHGIVQAHEGAIEVESQPGIGSIFTLYLPIVTEDAGTPRDDTNVAASAPAHTGDEAATANGGPHILYLDDDESLVFLVQRLLERRGFRVSGYTDQREALDAIRAKPALFDLVVTDYNMPGMSGLDVARTAREIRADLPIAIASGFIDEALRTQAEGAGVRELIFKANAVEDLCDAFARLAQTVGEQPVRQ
ncbi:MAG: PAS domain S-box protein [Betaproteobacteria bacterium]|nr:PAS domain S-box protein [Betaproteobacteria bacterium]